MDIKVLFWFVAVVVLLTGLSGRASGEDEPVILQIENGGAGVLAYSPDGKQLAAGGFYKDKSYIWDVRNRTTIAELTDCGSVMYSICYSSDGKFIATAGLDSEKTQWRIVLWNAQTGKRLVELPPNTGWRTAISADSKLLAVASLQGPIVFFQIPSGQKKNFLKIGGEGAAEAIAYSADGKMIAAAMKHAVQVWDLKTNRTKGPFNTPSAAQSVAFSPDGKLILAADDKGNVGCWKMDTGKIAWNKKPHEEPIRTIVVAPNGKFVASAAQDKVVRLLELNSGEEIIHYEGVIGSVQSVAISPDSSSIAVGQSGGIAIWQIGNGGPAKPATPQKSTGRPGGTVKFGGHSYLLNKNGLPWQLAKEWCEQHGGHLAAFETGSEHEFILKLCRDSQQSVWLGATDLVEEGKWKWVTGQSVSNTEASTWKLDDTFGAQHYLCYWKDTGTFDDAYGGERMPFICEWDD